MKWYYTNVFKKIEKYRITDNDTFEIKGNKKHLLLINTNILFFPEHSVKYILKNLSQAQELLLSVKTNNIAWKRT